VLFEAVGGPAVVKQMAAAGDGAAQFSWGSELMSEAGGYTGKMGAAGRSPLAGEGSLSPHRNEFALRLISCPLPEACCGVYTKVPASMFKLAVSIIPVLATPRRANAVVSVT
jgi:hypothetical protein